MHPLTCAVLSTLAEEGVWTLEAQHEHRRGRVARLVTNPVEARTRLAAAYCARQDGYTWRQIAAACGYASAASCLMAVDLFAARVGLPWPVVQRGPM